jgi:hypothetical protein
LSPRGRSQGLLLAYGPSLTDMGFCPASATAGTEWNPAFAVFELVKEELTPGSDLGVGAGAPDQTALESRAPGLIDSQVSGIH